ncbi:DUF2937 family protein [Pseudooceanicola sp.]|uniref:DUF2937 family protein n=1 Tax=Pseudooceanicola sp. TaxID=1914328 RepID=UPI0035C747A3
MIARTLTLIGGLAGAAGLSQFPEYSQQYTQRLAGAVDELTRVVDDFDRSATAEGLTRDEALSAMTGSGFVERRRADMIRTLARHEDLTADLNALKASGPFTRAYRITHFNDAEVARRALQDYQPALPLTFAGGSFAAIGAVLGMLAVGVIGSLLSMLFALLSAPFRRRRPS